MQKKSYLLVSLISLAVGAVLTTTSWAQAPRRGGGVGEWLLTVEFEGRQMESILALTRGAEGQLVGQWISFWGISDLDSITLESGNLSCDWTTPGRDGQTMSSSFKGTIAKGKLTGTLSGDWGEFPVKGERIPRIPRAVGRWAMAYRIGERDVTSTLVVKAGDAGALTAEWVSARGEHQISDVVFEGDGLSFTRKSTYDDREMEITFEGTVEMNKLTGSSKSERGEITVEGKRLGPPLIGTWMLDVKSEQGTRKQRLKVYRDLSARLGSLPIEAISLEDGQVSFTTAIAFGDQRFELSFAGQVEKTSLTGELTSSRGTQQVTGTKIVRAPRRPAAE